MTGHRNSLAINFVQFPRTAAVSISKACCEYVTNGSPKEPHPAAAEGRADIKATYFMIFAESGSAGHVVPGGVDGGGRSLVPHAPLAYHLIKEESDAHEENMCLLLFDG